MIKVRKDLTGQKFGRLTVVRQVEDYISPSGKHYAKWLCYCQCGSFTEVMGSSLVSQDIVSCGCFHKNQLAQRNKKQFKKCNDYEVQEDYVIMYTNKGEPFFVDLEDFWKVKNICWCKNSDGYIVGWTNNRQIGLHQVIMNASNGLVVDHIHGKESRNDNCKSNLRIATISQNGMNKKIMSNNTSGTTGVVWVKNKNKWKAQIGIDNEMIYLGSFNNKEDAVKARKEAEEKYFGEWSYNNSISNYIMKEGL